MIVRGTTGADKRPRTPAPRSRAPTAAHPFGHDTGAHGPRSGHRVTEGEGDEAEPAAPGAAPGRLPSDERPKP